MTDDLTALYRDALEAVRDALDLPLPAIDGDATEQRAILLEGRAAAVRDAIRTAIALADDPERVRREIDHLRVRISQLPVTYRLYATDAPTPVFADLNPQQADGLACVVCNATTTAQVPVGYSIGGTQVFACLIRCAPAVGYVAGPGPHVGATVAEVVR